MFLAIIIVKLFLEKNVLLLIILDQDTV